MREGSGMCTGNALWGCFENSAQDNPGGHTAYSAKDQFRNILLANRAMLDCQTRSQRKMSKWNVPSKNRYQGHQRAEAEF